MYTIREKAFFVILCLGIYVNTGNTQQYFAEHTIDASYFAASAIDLKDLNNDGKIDIIAGSHGTQTAPSSGVKCWINNGPTPVSYTGQVIDASYVAITCYAEDLNMDGFVDIIAGSWITNNIVYWLNSGSDPIVWTRRTLATNFRNAHGVSACDIDNDGDNDVLGAASGTNEIAVWYNNGGNPIAWTKQTISNSFGQAKYAYGGDIDEDGDIDVVGTAYFTNELAWWSNDGGSPITWTKFTIDNAFIGAHSILLYDIDLDTHIDILSTAPSANDIAWWRNNGGDPVSWTKQTIESDFSMVFHATASDFDNDGDIDIFGTTQPGNQQAYWINGGGSPFQWTRHDLSSNNNKPWPAVPFDVDNDGYMDVISGGDLRIGWWENISNVPSAPSGFSAYSDYSTPTSVSMRWTDPATFNNGTPLTGYKIHISRDNTTIAVVDSGIGHYTDSGLIEHEFYNYTLRSHTASDSSTPAFASSYAGGCPYALSPPTNFSVRDSLAGVFLQWKNPSRHTDGSPLNDLGAIQIYRNNELFDSLEQTHLDTGQVRTWLDPSEGYHEYYIIARDNDNPPHFSIPTNTYMGYGGSPFTDLAANFEYKDKYIYSTGDWDTTSAISFSGSLSFTDSPEGDYPRYANTYFLLPPVIIGEGYELRYHDITIVSLYHFAYLEISTDARKTFSLVSKYNSTSYGPWDDGHADPGDWREEIFNLSSYTGDTVTFRFRLQTSSGIIMDGWYVDSITVGGPDTVTPVISRTIALNGGWNLISLPIDRADKTTADIFPASASSAFAFTNGYCPTDTMETGYGYWLKYDSTAEIVLTGDLIIDDTIEISMGWNIIGATSSPVPVSEIYSIPPSITTSNCMGYDPDSGYTTATVLEPGKGYWIRSEENGLLILSPGGASSNECRINISPITEMPPPPPIDYMNITEHIPAEYMLYQNYPNPFNPNTVISYDLPAESRVTIKVYDILGQLIQILVDETQNAGRREIRWQPDRIASGTYILLLQATDATGATIAHRQIIPMLFVR